MLRVYRQFLEEIAADPSYRFTRAQDIVADVLGSHP
jgi:hypothetical protein